jgi:Rrf2 family protein
MLTQRAKYGLKALMILAGTGAEGSTLPIAELAQRGRIPPKFLEAILLDLRRHGFVVSRRGKLGGYGLARAPNDVIIGDVIRALDGPLAPIPCASLTAYRPCTDCASPAECAVRILMRRVRDAMAAILDHTPLSEMAVIGSDDPDAPHRRSVLTQSPSLP